MHIWNIIAAVLAGGTAGICLVGGITNREQSKPYFWDFMWAAVLIVLAIINILV